MRNTINIIKGFTGKKGERWITVRGKHLLINDETGDIVFGTIKDEKGNQIKNLNHIEGVTRVTKKREITGNDKD